MFLEACLINTPPLINIIIIVVVIIIIMISMFSYFVIKFILLNIFINQYKKIRLLLLVLLLFSFCNFLASPGFHTFFFFLPGSISRPMWRRGCRKDGGVGGGGGRLGPESCQRHHERPQEEPQHVSGADGAVSGRTEAASGHVYRTVRPTSAGTRL